MEVVNNKEEKKISVDRFIEIMNDSRLVGNYNIIKRKYVPVLEKKLVLQAMLNSSIQTDATGVRYIDMFLSKINFTMAILILYTKLDIKKSIDNTVDNMFTDYDKLVESKSLDYILTEIGDEEIKRLISINEQLMDTFYSREKTTDAYLHSIGTQIATVFGTVCKGGLEQLNETLQDDKKMKIITTAIDKFMKK